MAKQKKSLPKEGAQLPPACIHEQPITETLIENYMPYSMSVIISRAIPQIDGFKPAHRKLLYTMYKMGLLTGARTKSANVVGQTMKLNPHGDAAIYETMVRLTRGNEALLHPLIDSKGSFGKQYSEMAYAASRYTEVKLDPICAELFSGIDKDAVDFVDNYDSTMQEPTLLPTTFPNILVCPNMGIAVGLASKICSFNLGEICDATIALIEDPHADLYSVLPAPDFSTGGELIYDRAQLEQVYESGRGSFKLRAVYQVEGNCIEITQIPYSTTVEAIMNRIVKLAKEGKIKEISDVRDETDINGLKLAIDIKRGVDPHRLMARLYKLTTLEDDFACNFNVLISDVPRLLGVRNILNEWHAFRCECLKRELFYDLTQKQAKLHLLNGLATILLDIDKAIRIIRQTENERDVIPNLMEGFAIDRVQAEYIAEIKLRNLNREYILNRTEERGKLEEEIREIEDTLKSNRRLNALIIRQLKQIKKKYAQPRKTRIVYPEEAVELPEPEEQEYVAYAVVTQEGYFKKISLQSIRQNDDHKLKEGDRIMFEGELSSKCELLFFTDHAQVYKARLDDFENSKASALGEYVPAKLEFDKDERVIFFAPEKDFDNRLTLLFANGKGVTISTSGFKTKNNRRRLTAAFSDVSPVAGMVFYGKDEERQIFIKTKLGRALMVKSSLIPFKTTRSAAGVQVVALKKNDEVTDAFVVKDEDKTLHRYAKTKIPNPGVLLAEVDWENAQMKFDF